MYKAPFEHAKIIFLQNDIDNLLEAKISIASALSIVYQNYQSDVAELIAFSPDLSSHQKDILSQEGFIDQDWLTDDEPELVPVEPDDFDN